MTTERCKDIVLEKQKEGVCDSDYFYWDANERNQDDCFCCLGKEIDYKRSRSYSTYQILVEKEPVYAGGPPKVTA